MKKMIFFCIEFFSTVQPTVLTALFTIFFNASGKSRPVPTSDSKIEEFDRQGYTCNKIDNEFMIYGDTGFCGGAGATVLGVDLC